MRVNLIYFKACGGQSGLGGKYYTSGDFESEETAFHRILDEVAAKIANRSLPGLLSGHGDYHVLVTTDPETGSHLFVSSAGRVRGDVVEPLELLIRQHKERLSSASDNAAIGRLRGLEMALEIAESSSAATTASSALAAMVRYARKSISRDVLVGMGLQPMADVLDAVYLALDAEPEPVAASSPLVAAAQSARLAFPPEDLNALLSPGSGHTRAAEHLTAIFRALDAEPSAPALAPSLPPEAEFADVLRQAQRLPTFEAMARYVAEQIRERSGSVPAADPATGSVAPVGAPLTPRTAGACRKLAERLVGCTARSPSERERDLARQVTVLVEGLAVAILVQGATGQRDVLGQCRGCGLSGTHAENCLVERENSKQKEKDRQ